MSPASPLLVVGLGNPGSRYQDTRHNVGFLVVEELARRHGWPFVAGAGPWREAGGLVGGGEFCLLEPLTYMNLSGAAVAGWAARHGADLGAPAPDRWRPLVVCDDLALPLGAVRLRAQGSSGGQKGLESLIMTLGHDDFPRLRLGIAPAGDPVPPALWPDFVLTPFDPDERAVVADMVAWAADAVACWAASGSGVAASRFNRRSAPPDGPALPPG